eukprot:4751566-Prymnesium_polylepis.1
MGVSGALYLGQPGQWIRWGVVYRTSTGLRSFAASVGSHSHVGWNPLQRCLHSAAEKLTSDSYAASSSRERRRVSSACATRLAVPLGPARRWDAREAGRPSESRWGRQGRGGLKRAQRGSWFRVSEQRRWRRRDWPWRRGVGSYPKVCAPLGPMKPPRP